MGIDGEGGRMLEDALTFPRRGDWVRDVLIGGLLTVVGFLIIPAILVFGYLLRVLGESAAGADAPPAWDDWAELLVWGVVGWLIALAYAIPVILYSAVMLPIIGIGAITDDPGAAIVGLGALWVVGATLLSIAVGYVLPAALANFARTGRASAAFELRTVASIAFTGHYLVAVVVAIVVGILIGILGGIATITIIGIVLVPFIGFYGNVAIARALGIGVRRASTQ